MAAVATLELINDNEESPARQYWVEDDTSPGDVAVSESAAMAAVAAVAPASIDGVAGNWMRRQQLNDYFWRITLSYSRQLRKLTPLSSSTYIRGFQFRAKPRRYFVGAPTAKAPSTIPDLPNNLAGFEWQGEEFVHRGVLVTPPSVADTVKFVVPNASYSSTYISLVQAMCVDPGTWNNATFNGRAAGTVCLVAATITQRDDSAYAVQLGFGYRGLDTVSLGGDTLNLYGCDVVEFLQKPKTITVGSIKFSVPTAAGAYQYRFPQTADLNTLII